MKDVTPWFLPTRTGKPGKTGEHFPVREKSGNFAKTGKVRKFYPKYWKNSEKNYTGKNGKSQGNLSVKMKKSVNMVPYFQ